MISWPVPRENGGIKTSLVLSCFLKGTVGLGLQHQVCFCGISFTSRNRGSLRVLVCDRHGSLQASQRSFLCPCWLGLVFKSLVNFPMILKCFCLDKVPMCSPGWSRACVHSKGGLPFFWDPFASASQGWTWQVWATTAPLKFLNQFFSVITTLYPG